MTNILTAAEAALVLRCDETDVRMLALLPQIDAHIKNATGHAWEGDDTINETAKAAARILLVRGYEDPGMMGSANSQSFALSSYFSQLEALALRYVEFQGRSGAGPIYAERITLGDQVDSLVGISGVSGDQSSGFESIITVDGQIQQTSTEDLSDYWFRAHLVPVEDQ